MKAKRLRIRTGTALLSMAFLLGLALVLGVAASRCDATYIITDDDFLELANNQIGSGNGTLDYIFFVEAGGGGVADNTKPTITFDGDDANTDMPTGGPVDTVQESFVTSIGEIRDFYELNFPDGMGGSTVVEIALFVDLNQTGSGPDLLLNNLLVVADYYDGSGVPFGDDRDDPWTYNVTSALQNMTETDFTGTVLSQLGAPKVLVLNEQGAGFGDYAIALGINPFDPAFSDDTRLLFYWDSEHHTDGGETIFLSGDYAIVPEPGTMVLIGLGGLLLIRRKRS